MITDRVDLVLEDWSEERPELSTGALGIALRIQVLEKRLGAELDKCLAQLGLEWFEYDVLSSLRRQGEPFQRTASKIAEDAMLSPGALTHRIDHLLERGLVTRKEDPQDRRRVLITLTSSGRNLADKAAEARFHCAEGAIKRLSLRQRDQLDHLLKTLLLSLENPEGED